jgi:predicted permease
VAGAPSPSFAAEFEEIVRRLRQTPGVIHASAISGGLPMGGSMSATSIGVPGRELDPRDRTISIRRVTADYHQAIGVPLVEGRLFDETDRTGSPPVVILNQMAAERLFPGVPAVGKVVALNGERTVVGVVGNINQSNLETDPRTEAYVPLGQGSVTFAELVVRTRGEPLAVVAPMRAAVLGVLPDVPLRNVRTMEQIMGRQVAQRRLNMLLLGLFGLLGLVIAAVGIYGVMAYVVAQRTREIGVRMALGASRSRIIGMVLGRAGVLVAAGVVVGGVSAWLLSRTAESFLFRMDPSDPRAYAAALGVLVGAALVASLIPARRAASVNPVEALRAE